MHPRTKSKLLALGFDTAFIAKIGFKNHTLDALRSLSNAALAQDYDPAEVSLIEDRIKRKPIDDQVLERVLLLADECCCFCADGNRTRPYQVHHAVEYSTTQDNSEDNLIVVCPTHHQSEPKHLSPERQKAVRREWHLVVQLAKHYREEGVDYPFGLFVGRDYGLDPNPAEVVAEYRVSNATSLAISRHAVASEALARLRSNGILVVGGASGDGKSTLARGVGGLLAEGGFNVFAYQPAKAGREFPLKDVLTFVGMVDRPTVLIMDDANKNFSESDLSEIGTAAKRRVLVVATWSWDHQAEKGRFDRQLSDWFLVSWGLLRPHIISYLLEHEAAVSAEIQKSQPKDDPWRVGTGRMDTALQRHLQKYEDRAGTTSEFLFLMRAAPSLAQREISELITQGRADIPVLFAAVQQIAGFEQLVTPEEAAAASPATAVGSGLPSATPGWVREVYSQQVKRGRMQEVRSAYTTIHREWARLLIEAGLASERAKPELTNLLLANLDLQAPDTSRLARLWSWLWYKELGGRLVHNHLINQDPEAWKTVVSSASQQGLPQLAFFAERMHLLFAHPAWTSYVAAAFNSSGQQISKLIKSASPTDWGFLRGVAMALSHASPDLGKRVWEQWPPRMVARVIEQAQVSDYGDVGSTMSSISAHSPNWVKSIGASVEWEPIAIQVEKAREGDLRSILECPGVLTSLGVRLKRSMIRRIINAMNATARAPLSALRVGFPMKALNLAPFPEFGDFLRGIDQKRIAKELEKSLPRHWNEVFDLIAMGEYVRNDPFAHFADLVDPEAIAKVVNKYSGRYAPELRQLLYVLAHGTNSARSILAKELYPALVAACNTASSQSADLMALYMNLDSALGQKLALDTNTRPAVETSGETEESNLSVYLERLRLNTEKRDLAGDDYEVDFSVPLNG